MYSVMWKHNKWEVCGMSKLIDNKKSMEVKIGKYAIFFNKNYKYISIINEIMLALWFIIGSAFFFFESMKTAGIILFIIGSTQLLIRPILKILHAVSLRNLSSHPDEQPKH